MSLAALVFSFLVNNLMLKNLVGRVRPYEVVESTTHAAPLSPRAVIPRNRGVKNAFLTTS